LSIYWKQPRPIKKGEGKMNTTQKTVQSKVYTDHELIMAFSSQTAEGTKKYWVIFMNAYQMHLSAKNKTEAYKIAREYGKRILGQNTVLAVGKVEN
jgi:hypothetical protein